MAALFKIIQKNLKLLIRSRSSALVIILGPLLVIFLVGVAFDNISKYNLKVGTYSEEYSELSDSLIEKLRAKEYSVQKIESNDTCIEYVKNGRIHACLEFPKNLEIKQGETQELMFYVDYSKINLVYVILESISSGVSEQTSEISIDLTSSLLNKIDASKKGIAEIKPSIEKIQANNKNSKEKNKQAESDTDNALSETNKAFSDSKENRKYFLQKAVDAENEVEDIKKRVEDSNATDSQKNQIDKRLTDVGTYLYNIKTKVEKSDQGIDKSFQTAINKIKAVEVLLSDIKKNVDEDKIEIDKVYSKLDSMQKELSSLKITEAGKIVNPIETNIKTVVAEKTYLNYMFPALIVLVVMFISILLSNTLVMMEKKSPAYFRNFITPTRNITFILATYLTSLILVTLQVAIIIAIASYFFDTDLLNTLHITIVSLIVITTFFSFVGMVIGYLFNSEETSTLASILTGSVFLFMSNVIMPLESFPEYIANIAKYNPFILGETLLRRSIILGSGIKDMWPEGVYLFGASFLLLWLIWVYQRITRKHLLHRFKLKPKSKK